MKGRSPLASWLLYAIAVRLVVAWTHSSWAHPDEWYQTVEFANILLNGFGTHSQEVGLHLRNLSWPAMLTLPLGIARALAPGWIHLRIFAFQFFTGILDLGMVWAWWIFLRHSPRPWQHLGFLLLLFPWFFVPDSVRPSGEHLATIALWMSLACVSLRLDFWAGLLAVAIAAFKYPAGLLSLGILIGVAFAARGERRAKRLADFAGGCLAGLVVFGWADHQVYGRFWESLWMYGLYNGISGAGAEKFGAQPLSVYLDWWSHRWILGPWLPVFLILLPSFIYGFRKGLRERAPWVFSFVIYLIPHLLISHKEGRFLWPIETLFLWGSFVGLRELAPRLRQHWTRPVQFAVAVLLIANGALVARELWGETFKSNSTYFEMGTKLRDVPSICALVSVRNTGSVMMPWRSTALVPEPPFAYVPMDKNEPSLAGAKHSRLFWAEREPSCAPDWRVLLHLYRPDPLWVSEQGCTLLRSGILRVLPESRWQWAIDHRLVSGPWYVCPERVLRLFAQSRVEMPFDHEFPRMESLPSLHTPKSALIREARCEGLCF